MRQNEAVIQRLIENGIDTVFGIPGTQTLPLNEALDEREDVRFVVARHETAVSHEAWGYTETSGRMAATLVIPGPGDMNAMNGLKSALNDCVPILHLSVETDPVLRGGDAIHETPPDTYDNVVKENTVVKNPEGTAAAVERAIAIARTPPKGPVRVGIPKPFLTADVDPVTPAEFDTESVHGAPEPAIAAAVERLAAAESPFVIAGGGVNASGATDELRAVAERLDAPVATTYKGKGTFPEDHPLFAGTLCSGASQALVDAIGSADAMLGVGTDFDALTFQAWSVPMPDTLVHVTLDSEDIGTGYEPAVGIAADAGEALDAIEEGLAGRSIAAADGASRAEEIRATTAERLAELLTDEPPLTTAGALTAIRDALPRETVVTADAGGSRVWLAAMFEVYDAHGFVTPGSWGTMGTGLPSAIGAQLANPGRDVVTITGDGGVLMCLHELHTAVSEELPIVVIALNNDDYAIISERAERDYTIDRNEYDWNEYPIDFVTVAEGLGMDATKADTPDAIRDALETALDAEEPTLVEIRTDPLEPQAGSWMSE
jgi:acetolactate synthase-1/2/3 large subunit